MPPAPMPPDAIAALEQGRKIDAIKAYREATGAGLKESKEAVEAWLDHHPDVKAQLDLASEASRSGLVLVLMPIVLALAVWWAWG